MSKWGGGLWESSPRYFFFGLNGVIRVVLDVIDGRRDDPLDLEMIRIISNIFSMYNTGEPSEPEIFLKNKIKQPLDPSPTLCKGVGEGGGGQRGHVPPPLSKVGGGHKWVLSPPLLDRLCVLILLFFHIL